MLLLKRNFSNTMTKQLTRTIEKDIAIKVENVSKSFLIPTEHKNSLKSYFLNPFHKAEKRRFDALKDISFEVKKGEFIGIIGRNGSGKSTLLKILAGIYQPDKGKVTINGTIVPFLELGVGFNPELSGRENIFLNGTILGMNRKYLEEKFDEIVDFAEVREFIDMPLKNYSSGMQVRLAFAITTVTNGDIYLMDEVLAVGDSNFQEKCLDVLKNLIKNNKTVIFVSHDLDKVNRYCKNVIVLSNAKIVYSGECSLGIAKYNSSLIENKKVVDEIKSNKKKNQIRWGNNKVIFNNVTLTDKKNRNRNSFESGEWINFLFNYKFNTKVNILNVGIGIYNDKDYYVLGVNTKMDSYKIDLNKNCVSLRLNTLGLLKGKYYINIVLFGKDETKPYDWIGKYKYFYIQNSLNYRGIINLAHKWSYE